MGNLFQSVKALRPRLNKFNLSHERKFSLTMGKLFPVYIQDIVPGDKFRVSSEVFMRLAPLLAPIMHRVNVYTHYFFVPNRLVWDEWEDFITGGRLGTAAPVSPYITTEQARASGLAGAGTVWDHFALPTITGGASVSVELPISMIPFRAYQLIYDEFYRDQNLTAPLDILKTSGNVTGAEVAKLLTMRQRAWEKDYFTSALPFAQRGDTVQVPFSDDPTVPTRVYNSPSGTPVSTVGVSGFESTGFASQSSGNVIDTGVKHYGADGHGINVNDLRRSVRLQEWLERNARGGARYIEQILAHFGVISSDARLQRPEYLGGGKSAVQISEVLSSVQQVDGTGEPIGTPQGEMTGHGVSVGRSNGFRRRFEEHGYVIGLMSVLPRTAYQQGIPRHFTRPDKLDYYWPEFANIGEQEVKYKEIYYTPAAAANSPDATFGYQSRYAEYKYGCSSVHGEFKTNLDFWHMGRIFSAQPVLNTAFVESDPTTRVFATEDLADTLYCHLYNRVDALRPMPYYGTPTI